MTNRELLDFLQQLDDESLDGLVKVMVGECYHEIEFITEESDMDYLPAMKAKDESMTFTMAN